MKEEFEVPSENPVITLMAMIQSGYEFEVVCDRGRERKDKETHGERES